MKLLSLYSISLLCRQGYVKRIRVIYKLVFIFVQLMKNKFYLRKSCLMFLKTKFFITRVSPSVRTRQLGLFVNLCRLELSYRVQTFNDYSLALVLATL